MRSYIRRKRFEARLLAAELSKLFGAASRNAKGNGRVNADEMMAMMGATF
ncbi:MAG: hypothetical protein R2932_59320 [Caldilineaceae bacterium]